MENALKLFSFLRYLHFCPEFLVILVMLKNGFIRQLWLISKFMTSQFVQQIISIHILPNISRSKCNQTMKFGQVMEYNMRIIFLEASFTKCGEKFSLMLFHKEIKIQNTFQITRLFTVCPSRILPIYIKAKVLTICFYLK